LEIVTHPAVLAALIAGLILFQVQRYNAFKSASEKFRNTIYKELEGLYPTPVKWPDPEHKIIYILKDKFPQIEIAVAEFRLQLNRLNRKKFDEVWNDFHSDYFQYVPIKSESYSYGKLIEKSDTTTTYLSNFKDKVDALLKFAKQR
jgi:acyl carrier protein phosphodiesterase